MSDPVAWLIECDDGGRWCVLDRERAGTPICGGHTGTVTPLYREATLTDAEREVLRNVADDASYRALAYTEQVVRGLLERTK